MELEYILLDWLLLMGGSRNWFGVLSALRKKNNYFLSLFSLIKLTDPLLLPLEFNCSDRSIASRHLKNNVHPYWPRNLVHDYFLHGRAPSIVWIQNEPSSPPIRIPSWYLYSQHADTQSLIKSFTQMINWNRSWIERWDLKEKTSKLFDRWWLSNERLSHHPLWEILGRSRKYLHYQSLDR